ncbi:hypothetical protein ASE27_14600 [Oerskovia sp. Root918]|uniref:sensor histidine kinase n=1 Tax=unclassified Oerskovia TaxID=2619021 RepID=UPI0006F88F49|nr:MULTISPECIES: histidine kinase [unclassified Oerskovia]KRC32894.1 hypothetical protein ASE15_14275 [Oerskovia sp. Root22]KRD35938.1 hypothetical protein ASE27_14600 [Oerskovia sp. Root918]
MPSPLALLATAVLVLTVAGAVAAVRRYRSLARELHARSVVQAAAAERARLADDLHDALGHRLARLALRASALAVTGVPDAADLRREADDAVQDLHRVVDVLRDDTLEPVEDLVRAARAVGLDVTLTGAEGDGAGAPLLRTVVREGLTNAVRHAPAEPVQIDISPRGVTVLNRLAAAGSRPDDGREPFGLDSLERRVRAAGGMLSHGERDGSFVLVVSLPARPVAPDGDLPLPPSALRVFVRQALLPAAVVVTGLVLAYSWAAHDAVLDEDVFAGIVVGQERAAVEAELPEREAPLRPVRAPAAEHGWDCAIYTDGNFPLAMATLQICFDGDEVVRTVDLRERSWL